jgi:ribosomal-protein-alanine N-acetyltransferase
MGFIIRKLRLRKGLTQEQLADVLSVSVLTISRWETGVNYPDVAMLPSLAAYFHVTTDYLLQVGGNKAMKAMETQRLIIREWKDQDTDHIAALCRDPGIKWMGWRPDVILKDCGETIRLWREYQEMWPVYLRDGGGFIGIVGLEDVGRYRQYRELECLILEPYRRRGYATEAVEHLLAYGFGELSLSIAAASVMAGNEASRCLLEKLGFTYEGTLRRYGRDHGDRLRFSLTREEWKQTQGRECET